MRTGSNDQEEKIYNKVVRFATLRPRSSHEVNTWFKRKKVSLETAQRVFNRLKSIGLVDDQAFAAWWVEQRLVFRPRSRRLLILELRQKGVDRGVVEQVLASVEVPSEEKLAAALVVGRTKRLASLPSEERVKKLASFLGRKGFSWETIQRVLPENLKTVVDVDG